MKKIQEDYELARKIIATCKGGVPTKFSEESKYLLSDGGGNLIGFSPSLDIARDKIEEHAYKTSPKIMRDSKYLVGIAPPFYTITLLKPGTRWSKKYTLHQDDEISYLAEDFPLGADSFYEESYLSELAEKDLAFSDLAAREEELRKAREREKIITSSVFVIIFLIWLFGGFGWIEP